MKNTQTLDPALEKTIIAEIQKNNSPHVKFVAKLTKRRKVFAFTTTDGREIGLVYNNELKKVTEVLEPNALHMYRAHGSYPKRSFLYGILDKIRYQLIKLC